MKEMQAGKLAVFLMLCSVVMFLPQAAVANDDKALVWPALPAEPRIQYLKSFATREDVAGPRGFFARLRDFIIGPEEMAIRKPMGLAVDDNDGWLAVADPADSVVHIFNESRRKYHVITSVGKRLLEQPIAVASDGRGNLFIADTEHRQVHALSGTGKLRRSYGDAATLQRPTGIAVDVQRNRLYVADTPAHVVRIFNLGSGALVGSIGQRGMLDGEFNYPNFLTLDRHGRLYVTDALNGRIQIFDSEGRFVRSIGQRGDGSGDLSAPKGVALDSDGNAYVADARFDNIQIFDGAGRLLLFFGDTGQDAGMFWIPTGVAMGADNRLYVADSYNKRVQVFQYLGGADKP